MALRGDLPPLVEVTQATELSVRHRQRQIAAWHLPEARRAAEQLEESIKRTPRWRWRLRRRQQRMKASLAYRIKELQWAAGTRGHKGHPGPPPKL